MAKPVQMPYLVPKPTASMPTMGRKPPKAAVGGYARPLMAAPQADTISQSTVIDPVPDSRVAVVRAQFARPSVAPAAVEMATLNQIDRSVANAKLRGAGSPLPRGAYSYGIQPAAPLQAATQQIAQAAPTPLTRTAGNRYVQGYGQTAIRPAADVNRFTSAETQANGQRMLEIARARGAKPEELVKIATRFGIGPAPVQVAHANSQASVGHGDLGTPGPIIRPQSLTPALRAVASPPGTPVPVVPAGNVNAYAKPKIRSATAARQRGLMDGPNAYFRPTGQVQPSVNAW